MRENVLPPADPHVSEPNDEMFDIIAARYPGHLIELYQRVLDSRPDLGSSSLAAKIGASALPREQKIAVFQRAAREKSLERREWALRWLSDLDPQAFVKLYIKTLDELPRTPAGPYWSCKEARFGWLATLTADPRAWEALKRNAARVDVGLRMELLVPLSYCRCGPNRHPRQSLDLLASFLTDAQVRDKTSEPKHYAGPCAATEFPQLAVRDLAAMSIASRLKARLDLFPRKTWKAAEWAHYREKISMAMQAESQ